MQNTMQQATQPGDAPPLSPQELALPVRHRDGGEQRSPVVASLAETFRYAYPTDVSLELYETYDEDGSPVPLTIERCLQIMGSLDMVHRAVQWWIGDLLLYCEHRHGELYAQVAQVTGYSVGYLKNIVVTCRAIPPARRNHELSFSHHIQVTNKGLSPSSQTVILAKAAEAGLDKDQTRMLAQQILSQAGKIERKSDEEERQRASPAPLPVRRLPVPVSQAGAYEFVTNNFQWDEVHALARNLLEWAENGGVVDNPYDPQDGPRGASGPLTEPPAAIVIGKGMMSKGGR